MGVFHPYAFFFADRSAYVNFIAYCFVLFLDEIADINFVYENTPNRGVAPKPVADARGILRFSVRRGIGYALDRKSVV